jgi:hypothetical protein
VTSVVLVTRLRRSGLLPPQCVRTLGGGANSLYCEFVDNENFIEYYDHKADPWQLKNLAKTTPAPAVLASLKQRLQALRTCKGKACRPL